MSYSHRSSLLDSLLNKNVFITFFDGDTRTGVLKWDGRFYQIGNLHFRKSHITSIKY